MDDITPYLRYLFRTARGSGRYARPLNPPSGRLRKGVVNRILYYTGSFNPPHAGHLAALKYAVKHCGEDYNVVAIVVEMTHDESLEKKCRQQPGTLLLPSLTRMMYWEKALLQDEDLANKCWVVGGYDFCEWAAGFKDLVEGVTASSGFDVRVANLIGGDYIRPDWSSMYRLIGPSDFIVSNISRPVEIQDDQGWMITLAGCEPWEKISDDEEAGAVVWSCKKQVYQDYTIRFVGASEPMSPSPSSTAVQQAIATSGPEELEENLRRSGALVHEILAMAIRNWNW
ncbi:hypothetical protein PG984_001789 [Apiospora sp. TS-2023a]